MQNQEKLMTALFKLATGLEYEEVTEESNSEGETTKTKTVKKYLPPDLAALKWYMQETQKEHNVEDLTDEELDREWDRLVGGGIGGCGVARCE